MRLFMGIALAPETVNSLADVRLRFESPATDLRWSSPETWHVTLQFLGQTGDEQQACVLEKLSADRAAQVPVRIQGLGFFERAGVFWARVALTPELLALQQFVTAATRNCGFAPEARAWNPHITLARTKVAPVQALWLRCRNPWSAQRLTSEPSSRQKNFFSPNRSPDQKDRNTKCANGSLCSHRLRNNPQLAQPQNVASDSDGEHNSRDQKGSAEVVLACKVARNNGRGNSGELRREVHDAPDAADAFAWGNE